MQVDVVLAKFHNGVHGYSFSPNGFDLHLGDLVIVETEKGKDIVKIVKEKETIDDAELPEPLKNVIKMASEEDLKLAEESYKKAEALLPDVKKLVQEEGLEMKVIAVELNYNFSRITVNFTAETRVDFRNLVKRLAETFKTRIELRQIGPRDTTRILGGYGPCGLECCCHKGFGINDHITIKMAKNQGLSLNPNSISGVCGKMLCCLAYENEYYSEVLKIMPKVGSRVITPDGEGRVMYNDLLKQTVTVKFEDESSSELKDYPAGDIKVKEKIV